MGASARSFAAWFGRVTVYVCECVIEGVWNINSDQFIKIRPMIPRFIH